MNIISFEKLDSTNTYAKKNIDFLQDRMIVAADFQSNGYGRFKRSWVDVGSENIYMTFVLKPSDIILPVHANLTQFLSVVLCKQLEGLGLSPEIKWPNDVLLNGKKVCGILAESVIKGGSLKGIVLGIGVNLNASINALTEIDRPATSVNIELNKPVNKHEFRQKLLNMFFADYDTFLNEGFALISQDYERRSFLQKNAKIKLAIFNKETAGVFQGYDEDGNLLLLTQEGEIKKNNMGEIVENYPID